MVHFSYSLRQYSLPGHALVTVPDILTLGSDLILVPRRYQEMLGYLGSKIPRELTESITIMEMCAQRGTQVDLSPDVLTELLFAALLHDVAKPHAYNGGTGKLPRDLTDAERRRIEPHALQGRKKVHPSYAVSGLRKDAIDKPLPRTVVINNVLGEDETGSSAENIGLLVGNHHMIIAADITHEQQEAWLGRRYRAYPYDPSSREYQDELKRAEAKSPGLLTALEILQVNQFLAAVTNPARENIKSNPWDLQRIIRGVLGLFGKNE